MTRLRVPNKYPRKRFRTRNVTGKVVTVWYEKDPNRLYTPDNIESEGFKDLLIKRYDYRQRGCGPAHFRMLMMGKEAWESGKPFPGYYVPMPSFLALGRVLDPSKGTVYFVHKSHESRPEWVGAYPERQPAPTRGSEDAIEIAKPLDL